MARAYARVCRDGAWAPWRDTASRAIAPASVWNDEARPHRPLGLVGRTWAAAPPVDEAARATGEETA